MSVSGVVKETTSFRETLLAFGELPWRILALAELSA